MMGLHSIIKADKCFNYAAQLGVSMACLSTSITPISASFETNQQFNQVWFGAAKYDFDYFQATDSKHSSSDNVLYVFSNPISSYGTVWETSAIQTSSSTHYYRSTGTGMLQIYGDGSIVGNGSFNGISSR